MERVNLSLEMSNRSEQLEELEAFVSMLECFTGSIVYNSEGEQISGCVTIGFQPFEKRVAVWAQVDGVDDIHFRTLGVMAPAQLHFQLPPKYPHVPPKFHISCPWASEKMLELLKKKLEETMSSNADCPMLYVCAFELREEASKLSVEAERIRLDDTPFAKEKGLSGSEILKLMLEESDKAELAFFQNQCHDCEVCFENKHGTKCVRFSPCSHIFCMECVAEYFKSRISSVQVKALECMSEGCSSLAAQDVVRAAIGAEDYERYEKILLETALGTMDDMTPCPRPGCGEYVTISLFNRSLGTCPQCNYSFCVLCRKSYHGVDKCQLQSAEKLKLLADYESGENREDLIKRAGGEAALEKLIGTLRNDKWITDNSKPCPKCKANIEKNNGCNKMKCTKCDTAFCWLCGKRLIGDPYVHFSENGGGCSGRLFEGAVADAANPDLVFDDHHIFFDGPDDDLEDWYDDDDDDFDVDDLYEDYDDDGDFDPDDLIENLQDLDEAIAAAMEGEAGEVEGEGVEADEPEQGEEQEAGEIEDAVEEDVVGEQQELGWDTDGPDLPTVEDILGDHFERDGPPMHVGVWGGDESDDDYAEPFEDNEDDVGELLHEQQQVEDDDW